MTEDEQKKAGNSWYGGLHHVERILYIGDTLYTMSKGLIQAHDIPALQEKGSLEIPQN